MTDKISEAARQVAAPDVDIVARNPKTGPASIQGPEDGRAALPVQYGPQLVQQWSRKWSRKVDLFFRPKMKCSVL